MNNISFPKIGLKFNIDPIAIHYTNGGGVHWYGIIIAVGIVLALIYCARVSVHEGEDKELISDLVIWAIPISVIFARTYYVAFSWESYKDNIMDVFKIWEGGIAIYGAVAGAVVTAGIFFKIKKINVLKMFDICSLGLLIGQFIGRWGNFVNAEAFGGPCPYVWGMSINGGANVHPTFLYESLWNFVGFIILSRLNKKRPFYGFTFFLYISYYGLGRFFIEGMRTDSLYLGNVRISQAVALLCVVFGIAALIICFKMKRMKKMKNFIQQGKNLSD